MRFFEVGLISAKRPGKAGSSSQEGSRCMLFRAIHVPLRGYQAANSSHRFPAPNSCFSDSKNFTFFSKLSL